MLFNLQFGEKRVTNLQSVRCYFLARTATGTNIAMKDCPALRMTSMKKIEDNEANREFICSYESTKLSLPSLEMSCVRTASGRIVEKATIVLDLDPNADLIEVRGYDGFGLFRGNAKYAEGDIPNKIYIEVKAKAGEKYSEGEGLVW